MVASQMIINARPSVDAIEQSDAFSPR
jgi:hypothetical protein